MSVVSPVLLLLFLRCLVFVSSEDVSLTCVLNKVCVLPCRFKAVSSEVIHWYRGEAVVHSFYYNQDQLKLQNKEFSGRTSLFADQVIRGNASLKLLNTTIKDGGRYKCYTSTSVDNQESYVTVSVTAPIRSVQIELMDKEIHCLSRGIYPKPTISWSTDQSYGPALQVSTNTISDSEGLFSFHSRLGVVGNLSDYMYTCSISIGDGLQTWSASLKHQGEMERTTGQTLTIPCMAPRNIRNFTLTWAFIRDGELSVILTFSSQTGSITNNWGNLAQVDQHNVLSRNGSLQLQSEHSQKITGTYICNISALHTTQLVYTNVSFCDIQTAEKQPSHKTVVRIVAGVVFGVALLALVVRGIQKRICNKKKRNKEDKTSEKNGKLFELKENSTSNSSDRAAEDEGSMLTAQ